MRDIFLVVAILSAGVAVGATIQLLACLSGNC